MKNKITIVSDKNTGGVFYGHATLCVNKRNHTFTVCNHLNSKKEYEFRAITKARAGWNTIHDFKATVKGLWERIGKSTQCVQVKSSGGHWMHVYITKGGIWETIDVSLLETCTVGDIHSSAPKMADYDTWKRMNAETWADFAFIPNKKK